MRLKDKYESVRYLKLFKNIKLYFIYNYLNF